MSTTTSRRAPLATLFAGLGLTLVALIVLYVDHLAGNELRSHLRSGYPALAPADIDAAASVYLVYLSVLGVLGVLFWSVTTWAVATGKGWARWLATVIFLLAGAVSLTNLMITDTSGDTGLPPLLGWLGVLPCVAGLAIVVQLWRAPRPVRAGRP
ncbi:hypothetical protein [Microlunatus speluncae]|uniref:hypothetical protein n=1 Tax=Microlunatus speluncae TaxID=2594267 RepID=UPI001C2CD567|nr:hypothetical protein [Microlunatus speluncae]